MKLFYIISIGYISSRKTFGATKDFLLKKFFSELERELLREVFTEYS